MIHKIDKTLVHFFLLLVSVTAFSQSQRTTETSKVAIKTFDTLESLLQYTSKKSITLENSDVQIEQAKKAKLAAILGTVDITGATTGQFTNNTELGVSLLPGEIFGDPSGTTRAVQVGTKYNTNVTSNLNIKLINPEGWANLKLANINIALNDSNKQLALKNLQENIASNYYNIINLQEQIISSEKNLRVADTLYQITQNKFKEGLVNQQEVNESKINYLNSKETIQQLDYMLQQYYISLKLLCDVPEDEMIAIKSTTNNASPFLVPTVALDEMSLQNLKLQEAYAKANFTSTKTGFLPSLSLQLSNAYNLFNNDFEPVSGDWIQSNYIGLNLSIPLPNATKLTRSYNAKYEYQMAKNNTQQAEIQAKLDQESLMLSHQKALSQLETDQEIFTLRENTFEKNQQLYQEGIYSLDMVLNSFNKLANAQYNYIASKVNVQLALSKIHINNNIQ